MASAATGSTIVGVASGRCLDVIGQSRTDKAGVNLFDCNGQANQAWTYPTTGELRVYDSPKCLDVAGHARTVPATVQIYTCNGGANQEWKINSNGTITGVQSGLCLDVTGAGTANSTLVGLWTCNGQSNQQWRTTVGNTDTRPPTVPGSPRVSGLLCDAVTFSWNASTDNVGVAFYDVYHDGQLIKSVSGSTLSTGLTVVPGGTWGLYVNARDAAGNVSQASATVSITPPQCQPDTSPPSAPTQFAGIVSGTAVTLRWTASTDNVGVRAYDIYRNGAKVGTVASTGSGAPVTTFTDIGLAASTSYQYYVVACDARANMSPHSNSVTVTTGAACTNPVCTVHPDHDRHRHPVGPGHTARRHDPLQPP